eukprot:4064859-Prymnesium_polylepis.1
MAAARKRPRAEDAGGSDEDGWDDDANPSVAEHDAVRIAEEEGLTLVPSLRSTSGFKGVKFFREDKVYQAVYKHNVIPGRFATAEEAALAYARKLGPEASAAAADVEAAQPPTVEEVLRMVADEDLTLVPSVRAQTGYLGVAAVSKSRFSANHQGRPFG